MITRGEKVWALHEAACFIPPLIMFKGTFPLTPPWNRQTPAQWKRIVQILEALEEEIRLAPLPKESRK
jgi:hypothetical protein